MQERYKHDLSRPTCQETLSSVSLTASTRTALGGPEGAGGVTNYYKALIGSQNDF